MSKNIELGALGDLTKEERILDIQAANHRGYSWKWWFHAYQYRKLSIIALGDKQ